MNNYLIKSEEGYFGEYRKEKGVIEIRLSSFENPSPESLDRILFRRNDGRFVRFQHSAPRSIDPFTRPGEIRSSEYIASYVIEGLLARDLSVKSNEVIFQFESVQSLFSNSSLFQEPNNETPLETKEIFSCHFDSYEFVLKRYNYKFRRKGHTDSYTYDFIMKFKNAADLNEIINEVVCWSSLFSFMFGYQVYPCKITSVSSVDQADDTLRSLIPFLPSISGHKAFNNLVLSAAEVNKPYGSFSESIVTLFNVRLAEQKNNSELLLSSWRASFLENKNIHQSLSRCISKSHMFENNRVMRAFSWFESFNILPNESLRVGKTKKEKLANKLVLAGKEQGLEISKIEAKLAVKDLFKPSLKSRLSYGISVAEKWKGKEFPNHLKVTALEAVKFRNDIAHGADVSLYDAQSIIEYSKAIEKINCILMCRLLKVPIGLCNFNGYHTFFRM